ncbi:MAG: hypothetical protein DHS20C07_25730 [Methyloligella sp.]|nr:MAG: hypothetical protein DHS20C07_25730 [Methyloligella sp.]
MRIVYFFICIILFVPSAQAKDSDCFKPKEKNTKRVIKSCTKIITSKRLYKKRISNEKLAEVYLNRGLSIQLQVETGVSGHNTLHFALKDFGKAIDLNEQFALAYYYRGKYYEDFYNHSNYSPYVGISIQNYRRAFYLDPSLSEAKAGVKRLTTVREKLDAIRDKENHSQALSKWEEIQQRNKKNQSTKVIIDVPPPKQKALNSIKKQKSVVANIQPKQKFIKNTSKRIALVIGNNKYTNLPRDYQLKKARNDARSTANTFSDLGFDVISGFDLKRRKMNVKLTKFANKIEPGDEVMFFFAGHGVRIEGQNYLLPSDIPKITDANEDLLKSESLRVDAISEMFRKKGARLSLLVLDACRNNPFKDTRGRSVGGTRGLAPMDPPEGTLVLFSAGAGQEALDRLSDNDKNPNSVFTRIFLPMVKQEGLELSRLSRLVKGKVRDLAKSVGHKQTPAVYNEVIGDVYLAEK